MEERDGRYMRLALEMARLAARRGEVPVGCVCVAGDRVVGRGHNLRETLQDASLHAEMVALRETAAFLGTWRLNGVEVFVTLEPCPMCAGAMIQSRVKRVVFGAADPKAGAAGSRTDLFRPGLFNHDVEVEGGVLEEECGAALREFFRRLRGAEREDGGKPG